VNDLLESGNQSLRQEAVSYNTQNQTESMMESQNRTEIQNVENRFETTMNDETKIKQNPNDTMINENSKKVSDKIVPLKNIQNIFLFNKQRNIPIETPIWYVATSCQLISSEDLYRQYSVKMIDGMTLFRPSDVFQFSSISETKPLSVIDQENWTETIADSGLLKYTNLHDEFLKLKSLNETLDLNQQSIAKNHQSEIHRFVEETAIATEVKQEQKQDMNIVQEVDEEENKFVEVNKNKKKQKKDQDQSMYLVGMKQQNKVEKKETPKPQIVTPKIDINPEKNVARSCKK